MIDKESAFFTHMRAVHMDFHMPEFPVNAITSFNATGFVDHLERGRVNMVALFAKCHFGNSFYNTKAGHKHAGLPQDFLMEASAECRKRGIFTYAYYSLCTDVKAYREHENWRWIGRDGAPSGVNGPWGRLCLNTPYKEELIIPQLTEVIRDYPVDGLWLDIPVPSATDGCFCPSCRAKYRALYGRELDASISPEDGASWNYRAVINLIRELKHIIAGQGKDIQICSNRSGHLDSPLAFLEANDILCWESQPRNNYLSHSFSARYVRTLDRPTQVMSVRFYQGWGDLTLKPAAQMTSEFAAMIGNGVAATSGDQVNVDGTLQPAVYDMFSQAFGFVQGREELLRTASSVKDACILAPVPAHDRIAPASVGPAVKGAHKMLVESHIQFDIVNSQHIETLADYSTIVLPEPCEYDDTVFTALDEWVRNGGTLIACGASLVKNGRFLLEEVFGLEYLEPSVFSVSHFKPHPCVQGETDDLVLQCRTSAQKVIPTTAESIADYIYPQGESIPDRAFRNQLAAPPSDEASHYPFATRNSCGSGSAIYIAGSIFSAYWTYNHHWLRQFFDAVYRAAVPQPLYRLDAPGTVEANMMKTAGGDLLLNVIDYQVGHQGDTNAIPSVEKVYPRYNTVCEVRATGVTSVTLEPEGTALEFEQQGPYIRFTIPRMMYMAMVRIQSTT